MKNISKPLFFFVFILGLLCSVSVYADYNKGHKAYQASDYKAAMNELLPLANKGHAKSQYVLALIYFDNSTTLRDSAKGVEWLKQAAENGLVEAQSFLGESYLHGVYTDKSSSKALKWLNLAAKGGDSSAQALLCHMYASEEHGKPNEQKSFEWCLAAAKQGDAQSQSDVGFLYYFGRGYVKKDLAKAYYWLEKAAIQGEVYSQHLLGMMFYYGEYVTKDYSEAFKWYYKAAAQNHPAAQFKLALLYGNGQGVTQNVDLSIEWMQRSAALDYKDAIKFLEEAGEYNAKVGSYRFGYKIAEARKKYFDAYGTNWMNQEIKDRFFNLLDEKDSIIITGKFMLGHDNLDLLFSKLLQNTLGTLGIDGGIKSFSQPAFGDWVEAYLYHFKSLKRKDKLLGKTATRMEYHNQAIMNSIASYRNYQAARNWAEYEAAGVLPPGVTDINKSYFLVFLRAFWGKTYDTDQKALSRYYQLVKDIGEERLLKGINKYRLAKKDSKYRLLNPAAFGLPAEEMDHTGKLNPLQPHRSMALYLQYLVSEKESSKFIKSERYNHVLGISWVRPTGWHFEGTRGEQWNYDTKYRVAMPGKGLTPSSPEIYVNPGKENNQTPILKYINHTRVVRKKLSAVKDLNDESIEKIKLGEYAAYLNRYPGEYVALINAKGRVWQIVSLYTSNDPLPYDDFKKFVASIRFN
jgi:TPR repeat protein